MELADNHLRLLPHHLVPIQRGKVVVKKRKAGSDPMEDEGRLHYALGISEKGPGFRKNGN